MLGPPVPRQFPGFSIAARARPELQPAVTGALPSLGVRMGPCIPLPRSGLERTLTLTPANSSR